MEPPSREPDPPGVTNAWGEEAIIDALLRAAPGASPVVHLGPGDDAAVLADGTAVTVDTLVEGVHWDQRLDAADVGYKAVAVSVSDLGAMGARPAWMVLALSVPSPADPDWISAFAEGLGAAARAFGVALVGGDTTRSPGPRFVSITMGGPCPTPLLRSGGHVGDAVWVTGTLGLAGAGYLLADPPPAALERLRRPTPPLAFAGALPGVATSAMDLSDGLQRDLHRLCRAAGVGAVIDADALPVHPSLRGVPDVLALQVAAGDDYELLFTTPPHVDPGPLARAHGVAITRIGSLTEPPRVRLQDRPWPTTAWSHFGEAAT